MDPNYNDAPKRELASIRVNDYIVPVPPHIVRDIENMLKPWMAKAAYAPAIEARITKKTVLPTGDGPEKEDSTPSQPLEPDPDSTTEGLGSNPTPQPAPADLPTDPNLDVDENPNG